MEMDSNRISLEERFNWSQRITKLNQCTRCVTIDGGAECVEETRIFVVTEMRAIQWVEVTANHDSHIEMRSVPLYNIPITLAIHSVHSALINENVFLIVVCTPKSSLYDEANSEFSLYLYRCLSGGGDSDALEFTHERFSLTYCPVSIAFATIDAHTFLVVSGSDSSLHAYQLDVVNGTLHRTSHCDLQSLSNQTRADVCVHWNSRLQFESANALGLCLLIEEWSGGSQGFVGHANGLLFADAFPAPSEEPRVIKKKPKVPWLEFEHVVSGAALSSSGAQNSPTFNKVPLSPSGKHPRNISPRSLGFDEAIAPVPPIPSNTSSSLHSHQFTFDDANTVSGVIKKHGIAATAELLTTTSNTSTTPRSSADSLVGLMRTSSASNNNNLTSPPPVPRSRQCALLLDGAIVCASFFKTRRLPGNYSSTEDGGAESFDDEDEYEVDPCSDAVLVGTTSGVAAVLMLVDPTQQATKTSSSSNTSNSNRFKNALLPGSGDHGIVHSITGADIMNNGYLDVVIGFQDGTVIIAARVVENRSSMPLQFRMVWQHRFSSPVFCVAYGYLFPRHHHHHPDGGGHGNDEQVLEHLSVQTAQGFHVWEVVSGNKPQDKSSNSMAD